MQHKEPAAVDETVTGQIDQHDSCARGYQWPSGAAGTNRGLNVIYDMTLLAENDHVDKRKEIACSDHAFRFGNRSVFCATCGTSAKRERRYAYGRN